MNKKISAAMLALSMCLSASACGAKNVNDAPADIEIIETTVTDADGNIVLDDEEKIEDEAPAEASDDEYSDEDIFAMIDALKGEDNSSEDSEESAAETEAAESDDSGEFSLLDVSSDMIDAGLYAVDEEGDEIILSMFTIPDGAAMVSLFVFAPDNTGDVVCGAYQADIQTDAENGDITNTFMSFTDVYTGSDMQLAVIENAADGSCAVVNGAGDVYQARYLTADETVLYMGTAAALLS